jgi:hypothetical protein
VFLTGNADMFWQPAAARRPSNLSDHVPFCPCQVRAGLVPLISDLKKRGVKPDDAWLAGQYGTKDQAALCQEVALDMGAIDAALSWSNLGQTRGSQTRRPPPCPCDTQAGRHRARPLLPLLAPRNRAPLPPSLTRAHAPRRPNAPN